MGDVGMNTLYMETTKKEPEQTSAEIEALLMKYGLVRFMKDYKDGEVIGCIFVLELDDKEASIKLPVRWEPLWNMAQNGETRYIKDVLQAKRVAWRQVLRWIEAQLALVDLEMVDIIEVFLPYMMVSKLDTLYTRLRDNGMKLIEKEV